jgi:hypothetical protein
LQTHGVFTPKFSRLYQAFAQELQSEINEALTAVMHGVEAHDLNRFGKIRDARESELRDRTMSLFKPPNVGKTASQEGPTH